MFAEPVVLRPQSVLFTFLGDYVAPDGVLVAARSLVDLLGRTGTGEAAARATLSRMVRRDLLRREVRGRLAYFGLTDRGRAIVLGGRARVQEDGLVPAEWDGTWTVVSFSMPEAWQRQRHDLRSRLQWAGFGMAHGGLWIAPRRVDVASVLDGLDLEVYVRVFHGVPGEPTDPAQLIQDAYNLEPQAQRYLDFVARWDDAPPGQGKPSVAPTSAQDDPLTRRIVLLTDWLQVVREDPRLPLSFLPPGWPSVGAEQLFRRLSRELQPAAEAAVHHQIETIPRRDLNA